MRKLVGMIIAFSVLGIASAAVEGDAVSFEFTLEQECATSAGVYTPEGRTERTLWSLKPTPAGRQIGTRDGQDDLGRNVPPGAYEVRVACGISRDNV